MVETISTSVDFPQINFSVGSPSVLTTNLLNKIRFIKVSTITESVVSCKIHETNQLLHGAGTFWAPKFLHMGHRSMSGVKCSSTFTAKSNLRQCKLRWLLPKLRIVALYFELVSKIALRFTRSFCCQLTGIWYSICIFWPRFTPAFRNSVWNQY